MDKPVKLDTLTLTVCHWNEKEIYRICNYGARWTGTTKTFITKKHQQRLNKVEFYYNAMHQNVSETFVTGVILGMGSANERRRYIVKSSLICWAHNQNDPCLHPDLWLLWAKYPVHAILKNLANLTC